MKIFPLSAAPDTGHAARRATALRRLIGAGSAFLLTSITLSAGAAELGLSITSENCEIALAQSALPARLRGRAATYVWTGDDYATPKTEPGQFHCIVARNHPTSIIPICVTDSGLDTVLQGIIYKSRLAMQGVPVDEAEKRFAERAKNGEFTAPAAPGISYMMSSHNHIYRPQNDSFLNVPAHVMMFAPDVDPEVIGSATFPGAIANPGVPIAIDSGIHAYIVTFVAEAADSGEVVEQCGDDWQPPARVTAEPPGDAQ
ncbi:MAG: hypothetical protein QNJ14_09565 [Woeseiaceae bacterium]|nr:hypothetical protein [Woeseiaceae bacterium]